MFQPWQVFLYNDWEIIEKIMEFLQKLKCKTIFVIFAKLEPLKLNGHASQYLYSKLCISHRMLLHHPKIYTSMSRCKSHADEKSESLFHSSSTELRQHSFGNCSIGTNETLMIIESFIVIFGSKSISFCDFIILN